MTFHPHQGVASGFEETSRLYWGMTLSSGNVDHALSDFRPLFITYQGRQRVRSGRSPPPAICEAKIRFADSFESPQVWETMITRCQQGVRIHPRAGVAVNAALLVD